MSLYDKVKNFLTPANAGKEHIMGETQGATATPPANSGGLSEERVLAMVEGAIGKALGAITEKFSAIETKLTTSLAGTATPPAADAGKKAVPLTAEDVSKIVGDSLKNFAESSATADYARSKLADLPPTYQSLLPKTADAGVLAKAEQDIRARYKAEVGDKLAAQTPPLNSNGGGNPATGKVDVSKLNPVQKLEYALNAGTVATSGQSAAPAQAAAAAAAAAK